MESEAKLDWANKGDILLVALIVLLYPVSTACAMSDETPTTQTEPTVKELIDSAPQATLVVEPAASTPPTEAPPPDNAQTPNQGIAPMTAGDNAPVEPWMIKPSSEPSALNDKASYQTSLFSGAFTYIYPIDVPPGTNGLTPQVSLSYNSQGTSGKSEWAGLGWSVTENYIQRIVNGSPGDIGRHKYLLMLNGESYDLVYSQSDGRYHTDIESYLYITNTSGSSQNVKGAYWLVRTKDGTEYRFGYRNDSEKLSNVNDYVWRWSLDQVTDTHGNRIYYGYLEDPGAADNGTVYLANITYNNDLRRDIEFVSEDRPDWQSGFSDGSWVKETRRLREIRVSADSTLVRRYLLQYDTSPGTSRSLLKNITVYGSDDATSLPPTRFTYNSPTMAWVNDSAHTWDARDHYNEYCATCGPHYPNNCAFGSVNGDSLPDLICTQPWDNVRRCSINNGSGFVSVDWCLPPLGTSFETVSSQFVDLDGDGLDDVSTSTYDGVRRTNLSLGTGWSSNVSANSVWDAPVSYNYHYNDHDWDNGCRFIDVNLDGLVDIVCNSGRFQTYRGCFINNGSGFVSEDYCLPPEETRFDDGNVLLTDLNGDGYVDLSYSSHDKGTKTYLGNGTGWVNVTGQVWDAPTQYDVYYSYYWVSRGCQYVDVNGDGLPDLICSNGVESEGICYLNNGSGFVSADWCKPPVADGYKLDSVYVKVVDMDGDGYPDLSYSNANTQGVDKKSYLNNGSFQDLLATAVNPLGGQIAVSYNMSSKYNSTDANGVGRLSVPLPVVASVVESNSLGGAQNTASTYLFSYRDGLFVHTPGSSEFRGFAQVNVTRPDGGVISHFFYQNDSHKGMEYKTEVYNVSGSLFTRTETSYTTGQINGAYVVLPSNSTVSLFDGYPSARITGTSYDYDAYGNVNKTSYYGDLGVTGDEKTEVTQYVYNSSIWLVDRVKSKSLYDAGSNKVSEAKYQYDGLGFGDSPTRGELSREEHWLSNGGDNPALTYGYDSYGNRVNVTDPRGGVTKYVYGLADSTYTYPEQVVNPLGQTVNVNYLLSTGALNCSIDPNGYRTQYAYDVFGRLSSVVKEYDSSAYPTVDYSYFTGSVPNGVRTRARVSSGSATTFDSVVFVDGFGRQIQSRIDAEPTGQQVVKNTFYDSLGRVSAESVPYFASYGNYSSPDMSVRNVSHQYDVLDRETKTVNTDATYRTVSFNRWNVTASDENGHAKVQTKDGYDRITDVYEVNGADTYRTRYFYDDLDNLINITDNLGNIFRFEYDSLKRMTGLRDPDLGNWTYGFDGSGNMVNQTDARGIIVKFEYDLLNRLTKKDYPTDTDVVLTYDVGKVGVLSQADSAAGNVKFEYDNRLRQTAQNYTYGDTTYWTRQAYDSLDRVTNVSQSNGDVLSYTYNSGGMLDSIPGYVTGLDYTALGKVANRTYNNSLVSKLDYYSDSFRLKSIMTGSLQNLSYSYDPVGNVLSMNDYANSTLWSYGYDSMDRLVSANESGGLHQSFGYNSIGNLVIHNNGSAVFNYAYGIGAGVHAVSAYSYVGYTNYAPPNISINCSSGINPVYDSDWNITQNTACSGGIARLSQNRTVYVAVNTTLDLSNATVEPTGLPGTFINLDAGSELDLGAGAQIYGDDAGSSAYSGSGTANLTYDANGNMVNDTVHVFVYNDDSRMSQVKDLSGNLVEAYQYDHEGKRRVKLGVLSPGLNLTTVYFGDLVIYQYSNGSNNWELYGVGNNENLFIKYSNSSISYLHPDHLGSTTVISDSSGALIERLSYLPYGQVRQNSQQERQYTGHVRDQTTGLTYAINRYYNPVLMKWTQPDIKVSDYYNPQYLNRYAYVGNNPLRYTDPTGHVLSDAVVVILAVVILPFVILAAAPVKDWLTSKENNINARQSGQQLQHGNSGNPTSITSSSSEVSPPSGTNPSPPEVLMQGQSPRQNIQSNDYGFVDLTRDNAQKNILSAQSQGSFQATSDSSNLLQYSPAKSGAALTSQDMTHTTQQSTFEKVAGDFFGFDTECSNIAANGDMTSLGDINIQLEGQKAQTYRQMARQMSRVD